MTKLPGWGVLLLSITFLLSGCASVQDSERNAIRLTQQAEATAFQQVVEIAVNGTLAAMPTGQVTRPTPPLPMAPTSQPLGGAELDAMIAAYPGESSPRPVTAEEVAAANTYREDHPDQIGTTGLPQLIVFYNNLGEDAGGCINCSRYRGVLQELEVELWGRLDFIYLNNEYTEIEEIQRLLGITSGFSRKIAISMVLLDADGERIRVYRQFPRSQDKTPSEALRTSLTIQLDRVGG